ncbi:MAG: ABC transporter permease subunit, partial [Betaproteobacteria bacterium]|nr:ABC transporter permease subunit [Betaproteobacteria bacterium]
MPPLVFMFIFFYFIGGGWFEPLGAWLVQNGGGLGEIFFGNPRMASNFLGGVLCLAIFEGAFFAEIIRAGVLSVEGGQWEAARAVGLSRRHILRFVVLPQAAKNAAAPLAGQLVFLVKDSAILSVISVPELAFSAQEAAVSSRQIFEVWLLAAAFYFALCWPLLHLAQKLERRR